jgi:hypothetical protein
MVVVSMIMQRYAIVRTRGMKVAFGSDSVWVAHRSAGRPFREARLASGG